MNNLTKRIITGILGAGIFALLLIFNYYSFLLLFWIISVFCIVEFIKPIQKKEKIPLYGLLAIHTLLYFLSSKLYFTFFNSYLVFFAFIISITIFFIRALYLKNINPIYNISYIVLILIYLCMPFWLLDSVAFEGNDYSYWKILGIFILIWTNDSMAYFTGKFLGKKKLFERISPNKTWIGFFGGLIFSVIASYILSMYKSFYPVWMWLSIGVLVPVVGTYGDLIQSMWKRHFNLKDSGNMLPGHGGFYDRFDSFILIVPHVFIIEHLLWVF